RSEVEKNSKDVEEASPLYIQGGGYKSLARIESSFETSTCKLEAISYPDDSKDPFEAGDLVEISEVVEYVETNAPMFKLPPELIAWYKEGRRRLYSDRDDIMEWLRLKRINKLDGFIRYLNLD
ncbi:38_t:CDS:2, partial [Entrophospora sp. SA101]